MIVFSKYGRLFQVQRTSSSLNDTISAIIFWFDLEKLSVWRVQRVQLANDTLLLGSWDFKILSRCPSCWYHEPFSERHIFDLLIIWHLCSKSRYVLKTLICTARIAFNFFGSFCSQTLCAHKAPKKSANIHQHIWKSIGASRKRPLKKKVRAAKFLVRPETRQIDRVMSAYVCVCACACIDKHMLDMHLSVMIITRCKNGTQTAPRVCVCVCVCVSVCSCPEGRTRYIHHAGRSVYARMVHFSFAI